MAKQPKWRGSMRCCSLAARRQPNYQSCCDKSCAEAFSSDATNFFPALAEGTFRRTVGPPTDGPALVLLRTAHPAIRLFRELSTP